MFIIQTSNFIILIITIMSLKSDIKKSISILKKSGMDDTAIVDLVKSKINNVTKFAIARFLSDLLETLNYNKIYDNEDNLLAAKEIFKILDIETGISESNDWFYAKRDRFTKSYWPALKPINKISSKWVRSY